MRLIRSAAIAATLAIAIAATLPSPAFGKDRAQVWKGDLPIRQPWLRDHMPDEALVYFRVPHILGLLSTPKGNAMDPALRSTAHVENLTKIKKGISENVLNQIPMFADLRVRLFEEHLRSPVEIAAFMAPAPSALIAFNLDLESNDALYEIFEVFALISPNFALEGPLDDQGIGTINGPGIPLFLKFNADSGLMLINGGPAVTRESFVALIDAVAGENQHRMATMEQDIDESGQGLFFWIDSEQAMPALQAFLPPEQLADLNELGLNNVRAAALGWGVSNGKGRLAIVADVPTENNRDFLPYVNNKLSAKSVGNPDGLFLISVPTASEFSRIEALSLQSASIESREDWVKGKASFHELAGVSIEELLGAIGPEVMMIFDAAGDYAAMRLRDRKMWDEMLSHISQQSGISPDEKRIDGNTYYHWSAPGNFGMNDALAEKDAGWLASLMQNQRDHIYWTIDGDFLYAASVPQPLIERAAKGASTDIGKWLADEQRIDATSAVLSMTGTNRKLPKRFYAVYIEVLQFLADISKTEIDIWSMPTAAQLDLPDTGAVAFTVNLGNPNVSAELMFENNPFEILFGGGATSVAAVGIMAAIAVPAYQDYTVRAKVSEGFNLSGGLKARITEFYRENGRFPDEEEAAEMSINAHAGAHVNAVLVEPDTGTIVVVYIEDALPDGGELYLEPLVEEGRVTWSCSATIADKHVPAACRE